MTFAERFDMIRKRHAFLHGIATQYSSLETFAMEKDEWFAVRGIKLTLCEKYISLYIYRLVGTMNMKPTMLSMVMTGYWTSVRLFGGKIHTVSMT